jgi:hypothetical protein
MISVHYSFVASLLFALLPYSLPFILLDNNQCSRTELCAYLLVSRRTLVCRCVRRVLRPNRNNKAAPGGKQLLQGLWNGVGCSTDMYGVEEISWCGGELVCTKKHFIRIEGSSSQSSTNTTNQSTSIINHCQFSIKYKLSHLSTE